MQPQSITLPKTCKKCGKEIHRKRNTAFCSRTCSDSFNKSPRPIPWVVKQCAYCGKEFECEPWRSTTIACSVKCSSQYRAKTVQGRNHPLFKEKVEMACEICGKLCHVKPSLVSRFRACSRRCAATLSTLAQSGRISSIERIMSAQMLGDGLSPVAQLAIGYYVVDFAFPEQKLVVECDGVYWHSLPKQQRVDHSKDAYLVKRGWQILRLSEADIKASPHDCLQRIQAILAKIAS